MRARLATAARVLFGVAGASFLAVAFWETWDRSADVVVPAWWRLLISLVAVTVAMSMAYRGWAALFQRSVRSRELAAGFYLSQLGKYVPGGVWQAAGQVGYAIRAEVSPPRAATAFVVFSVTQATAGAIVGASVGLLAADLAWWLRAGTLAAASMALLLDRRWMAWAVGFYRRRRSAGDPGELVPAQQAILRSCAWSVGTMLGLGIAFAALLSGLGTTAPLAATVTGFSLAWTVGFLAVPFPAGLGIREAVLITVLGPATGVAPLIAASVYFRLSQMGAEALLILATRRWRRRTVGTASSHG